MKVGQTVTFRDCYGSNPKTGTIVKRNAYSSHIDVGGSILIVADCLVDAKGLEEEPRDKGNEEQFSLI